VDLDCGQAVDTLQRYGDLQTLEGCKAVFLVRREVLTQTVSQLLAELPVQDLTVADPPIEDVIGRVFQAGTV
jgi:ABC-2 type transport system ATP-binding protein